MSEARVIVGIMLVLFAGIAFLSKALFKPGDDGVSIRLSEQALDRVRAAGLAMPSRAFYQRLSVAITIIMLISGVILIIVGVLGP